MIGVADAHHIRSGPTRASSKRDGPMAVIEAQGIWKTFERNVTVRDVSIALEAGQVLGMVGPNGAGKTTTIRMLLRALVRG